MSNSSMQPIIVVLGFLALYMLPTIIAMLRNHRQTTPIFLLNLLLGFTVLGWVIPLAWAFVKPASRPAGSA